MTEEDISAVIGLLIVIGVFMLGILLGIELCKLRGVKVPDFNNYDEIKEACEKINRLAGVIPYEEIKNLGIYDDRL